MKQTSEFKLLLKLVEILKKIKQEEDVNLTKHHGYHTGR